MTDESKPVRCGCGGEAEVRKHTFYRALPLYRVCCRNCGVSTPPMSIVDNAITAWNRAMGADKRIFIPDGYVREKIGSKNHD